MQKGHAILRGCAAELRALQALRHGNFQIGKLQQGMFGFYVEASVEIHSMVDETTYENA